MKAERSSFPRSERVIFCHLAYEAGWRYRYSMDFSLLQDGVA
jgi:hypothetical protein